MANLFPLQNSSLVNILTLRYDPSLKPNLPRKTSNDFKSNNIIPDTEFIEKTICDNIEQNLDKPWNWGRMLDNPNITWEFIKRNLDKQWDWSQLSDRKIKIEESWIYQRRVEHIKAFQIQRHWRNCSCNPKYKLAQRMLSRLYKS